LRTCIAVLCVALAAAGCRRSEGKHAALGGPRPAKAVPTVPPRFAVVGPAPSVESLRKVPLDGALEGLDALYRLKPDRRFLIAIAEVERLLAGASSVRIRLDFRSGQWEIYSGGQSVGRLPEIPSFSDACVLLSDWSQRQRLRRAVPGSRPSDEAIARIRAGVEQFLAPRLIDSLGLIDHEWRAGHWDSESLSLAGHALVLLNLQEPDRLDMADLVSGRALATLSLAEAFGSPEASGDKALLGARMGYGEDARRLAEHLPAGDPVRLFVHKKTRELLVGAAAIPGDREGQYLALLRLADSGKAGPWQEWFQAHFFEKRMSLPVLHAGLELSEFGPNPAFANAILHSWMADLSPSQGDFTAAFEEAREGPKGLGDEFLRSYIEAIRRAFAVKPAGLIRRFESALESRSAPASGPFWDKEASQAFARASFYSALHVMSLECLDKLSDVEGTQLFAAYLKDAPPGPGGQFASWYGHLAEVKAGGGHFEQGLEDLSALDQLGLTAIARTFENMKYALLWKTDVVPDIVSRLIRRFDTRISHQVFLTRTLFDNLHDLRRTEKLCGSISSLAPFENAWYRAWCAQFVGNTRGLLVIGGDPQAGTEARSAALNYLRYDKSLANTLRSLDRRLLEDSNYEREAVRPYLNYLEFEVKDYRAARGVAEAWLSRHQDSDSLLRAIYTGRRAHLLSLEGRDQEAWAVIEPVIETWQGAILSWACQILERLGRHAEAVDLARKAVERYPDSGGIRGDLAELLWRGQRYSDAADVVWSSRYQPDLDTWRDSISKNFVRAFRDRGAEDALEAFMALIAQRVKIWSLQSVPEEFAEQSRFDVAFQLETPLLQGRGYDYYSARVHAYRFLKAWKGKNEAISWLRGVLEEKKFEPGVRAFFEMKEEDLLWDVYPSSDRQWSSSTWLLRACAAALGGLDRSPHREPLLAHFQSSTATDIQTRLGRFVLGLEGPAAASASAVSEEDRSLTAFAFGVRAVREGDYPAGSDWFQLATLFGKDAGHGSGLGEMVLGRWYSAGKALAFAAKERRW